MKALHLGMYWRSRSIYVHVGPVWHAPDIHLCTQRVREQEEKASHFQQGSSGFFVDFTSGPEYSPHFLIQAFY